MIFDVILVVFALVCLGVSLGTAFFFQIFENLFAAWFSIFAVA